MKNSYFVCLIASILFFSMMTVIGCGSSSGGGSPTFSADIYVSTAGSDEAPDGDGTWAKPFRTIQKGLYSAGTDEVVGVLAGVYIESLSWPTTYEGITLRGIARSTAILSAEANERCIVISGTPSPQTITIESMTIQNSDVGATDGGGIYLSAPITLNLRNVKVHKNMAVNGGGLYMLQADTVIIYNCVFSSNETVTDGGSGGAIMQSNGTLLITNSEFYGNYGGYGNIFATKTIEVTGCNIHDNTATNYGAGFAFTSSSSPYVINSTFEGNEVLTGGTGVGGGGIFCQWTVATIEGCTFKNNSAADDGGSVHFDTGGPGGQMNFKKCRFLDNHANNGGAIYAESQVDLEKCLFVNNTAEASNGGAIFLTATGTAEIVNSIFKFNKAISEGGAIYFTGGSGSEMEIYNCTFVSNEANSVGSAIELSNGNEVTIVNTLFRYNKNNGSIYEVNGASGSYTNKYCNYEIGALGGAHSFTENTNTAPVFVSYPNNLHLHGSCTIEVTRGGTIEGAPDEDYDDVTRSDPYSIGAYEGDTF